MGNSKSQLSRYSIYKQKQCWKKISNLGYCDLVYDCQTGIKGQLYQLVVEQPFKEIKHYQFRKDNWEYLVGIHSVSSKQNHDVCANLQNISVVTERIPYRLVDLGQISLADGIYMMEQAFNGARIIYNQIGGIKFQGTMICINQEGETKIWLNENIGKNQPEYYCSPGEKQVVNDIFQVIESIISDTNFDEYMRKKQNTKLQDFISAIYFIHLIKKRFSIEHERKITFPPCKSINDSQFQEVQQSLKLQKKEDEITSFAQKLNLKGSTFNKNGKLNKFPPLPPKNKQKEIILSRKTSDYGSLNQNKPIENQNKARNRSNQKSVNNFNQNEEEKHNMKANQNLISTKDSAQIIRKKQIYYQKIEENNYHPKIQWKYLTPIFNQQVPPTQVLQKELFPQSQPQTNVSSPKHEIQEPIIYPTIFVKKQHSLLSTSRQKNNNPSCLTKQLTKNNLRITFTTNIDAGQVSNNKKLFHQKRQLINSQNLRILTKF